MRQVPPSGERIPKPVDFTELAKDVLASDLFTVDEDVEAKNRGASEYSRLPTYALEAPYGNGPMVIKKFGKDVPAEAMVLVRNNFIRANHALLPTEKVLSHFHHSFADGSVFRNRSLPKLVQEFSPKTVSVFEEPQDERFSFAVDAERKVENRKLFTRPEIEHTQEFTEKNPEVVLTILLFQTTIQDYFGKLRQSLVDVSAQGGVQPTEAQMKDFDTFARQWATGNFADELVPAVALFARNAELSGQQETITKDTFEKALNFIIVNGSFRNFVNIPAHVANDGVERTNRFMCPALGKIKSLLLDGSLLEHIYQITKKAGAKSDSPIARYLSVIASKATDAIAEEKTAPRSMAEMHEQNRLRWEAKKTRTISVGGKEIIILIDEAFIENHKKPRMPGDTIMELRAGDDLYEVFEEAILSVRATATACSFNFNDKNYRITPEELKGWSA